MRPGLRPQIVLLLAVVLGVSFVPLYFAVSTYTKTAHTVAQRQQAVELAQTVVAALDHRRPQGQHELSHLLQGRVIALHRTNAAHGARIPLVSSVPIQSPPRLEPVTAEQSPALVSSLDGTWVGVPLALGDTLWVLVKAQPSILGRLDLLLLAYMGMSGFVLLAGTYTLITHRIIRPLDELSHAARRVTETDRPLVLPHAGSREFSELNRSLQAMTDRLLREEAALRNKVTEVETRTQQLRAAQAQLVRSERLASVGQLAAGVAHEVGNPIAALMGLQDLILQGGLTPEEQDEFVRRMRKETQRIHRIVRDLLHFARPKPETLGEGVPSASLRSALDETLGLLQPQPSWRDIDVQIELANELPPVAASHEALVQIFLNLLLNAAHACGAAGVVRVEAKLSATSASEGERGHPGLLEVRVEDTGPGVPEELRETLFEPFVSGKDVGEGTGLGLSVCRNLVDQIAATTGVSAVTLELDQTFTAGARFVLRLPTSSQTS